MPIIYVTSIEPGAGKTGVAAAIARHYAYQGVPTTLFRFAGGDNAEPDAAFFARQFFVPGAPPAPIDAAEFQAPGPGELAVIEGPADAVPPGATCVVVAASSVPDIPETITPAVVVITRTARQDDAGIPEKVGDAAAVSVAEDRCLAGFTIEAVRELLHADMLVEGEPDDTTCDHLIVSPIGSDAGQPYFRRFARAAVIARYDKTDMQLAALRSEPVLLILTGGRRPSEYLFDAARAKGVQVLLSRTDTENTVIALEGIFDETRFVGQPKLDRMAELLEKTGIFEALGIEVPTPAS